VSLKGLKYYHIVRRHVLSLSAFAVNFSFCSSDPQFSDVLFFYAVAQNFSAFAPVIHNFLLSCFSMQSPTFSVHLLQWTKTYWCLVFLCSRPANSAFNDPQGFVVLCSEARFGSASCRNFRHVCDIVSVLIAVLFRTHRCCPLTSPARLRAIGAHLPSSAFVPPRRALATASWQQCMPLLLLHILC
jgi:hypothetical protein